MFACLELKYSFGIFVFMYIASTVEYKCPHPTSTPVVCYLPSHASGPSHEVHKIVRFSFAKASWIIFCSRSRLTTQITSKAFNPRDVRAVTTLQVGQEMASLSSSNRSSFSKHFRQNEWRHCNVFGLSRVDLHMAQSVRFAAGFAVEEVGMDAAIANYIKKKLTPLFALWSIDIPFDVQHAPLY